MFAAPMLDRMAGLAHPALLQRAVAMIRATATHAVLPGLLPDRAQDTALFLDLGLAVLAADRGTFDACQRGIAAEHGRGHGAVRFRAGRLAFLQAMLARPRLFLS